MSDLNSSLRQAWLNLPQVTNEPQIASKLVVPEILNILGYSDKNNEINLGYKTGIGAQAVDIAARKNFDDDIFTHTLKGASIIVEIKKRNLDLSSGSSAYKATVRQLKRYLHPSAVHCRQAKWGIITNANHIQLFRRHGRVVYPLTTNMELSEHNIDEKIQKC